MPIRGTGKRPSLETRSVLDLQDQDRFPGQRGSIERAGDRYCHMVDRDRRIVCNFLPESTRLGEERSLIHVDCDGDDEARCTLSSPRNTNPSCTRPQLGDADLPVGTAGRLEWTGHVGPHQAHGSDVLDGGAHLDLERANITRAAFSAVDKDSSDGHCSLIYAYIIYGLQKIMSGLTLDTPHLAAFIARRNSGKSHLMKYLLHALTKGQKFAWVLVVTPTAFTGEWSEIVGEANVREAWNETEIEKILNHQAACREKGKPNPGLLILDDCLGSVHFNSPICLRLASTGRHFDITCWLSFQHYAKTPTFIRSNVDHLFILNPQNDKVIRSLHDEFSPEGYPDWREWKKFVLAACKDYGVVSVGPDRIARVIRAPAVLPIFKLATGKRPRKD
jgi:hypothetical protein